MDTVARKVPVHPTERCPGTASYRRWTPVGLANNTVGICCDQEGCYALHQPADSVLSVTPPKMTYNRQVCVACGAETAAPHGQPHNGECPCIFRRPIDDRPSLVQNLDNSRKARLAALEAPMFVPSGTIDEDMPIEPGEVFSASVPTDDNFQIAVRKYPKPSPEELDDQEEPEKGKQDFNGTIDGVGYKGSMDDPEKPPISLVTRTFIWAVARVLGIGATKYSRGNWMRGMSFTEVANGILRHVTAWISGETYDQETGENHLAHAACGIMFLLTFQEGPRASEYEQFDDRLSEFNKEVA